MSKRLEVLLEDAEYREIARLACARRTTVTAWVREAIQKARGSQPSRQASDKLRCVRAAARHEFPTADIDQMLAEIGTGHRGAPP